MNYLLDLSFNRHNFFNDAVNWDRHFDWNNSGLFNFDHFLYFNNLRYNSFNFDFSWYFNSNLDYLFGLFLYDFNNFVCFFNRNNLLDVFLDYSIDFSVDVLNGFNLNDSVLDDGDLNKSLHLSNPFNLYNSIYYFFDDLGYLNNLLDDSGYNHNFFNNLFNFNNFGHLNHLFNDLINGNSNFFYSFNCSWYLNNFLYNYLDWVVLSDEMID